MIEKFKHLRLFTLLYGVLLFIDLIARYTVSQELEYLVKPLLMPVLALFFYLNVKPQLDTFVKLIFVALFFSWGGDVLLMFVSKNELFFLAGLGSFLLAHIAYIFAFLKTSRPRRKGAIAETPWLVLPFIALDIGMLYILKDAAGDMFAPIVAYTLVISLMGIAAVNRYRKTSFISFRLIFVGALLFILSDSMIATNEFLLSEKSPFVGMGIMIFYCLSQYLITLGALFQVQDA